MIYKKNTIIVSSGLENKTPPNELKITIVNFHQKIAYMSKNKNNSR